MTTPPRPPSLTYQPLGWREYLAPVLLALVAVFNIASGIYLADWTTVVYGATFLILAFALWLDNRTIHTLRTERDHLLAVMTYAARVTATRDQERPQA